MKGAASYSSQLPDEASTVSLYELSVERMDVVEESDRATNESRPRAEVNGSGDRRRPASATAPTITNDALRLGTRLTAALPEPHRVVLLTGISASDRVDAAALETARGMALLDDGPVLLVDAWPKHPLTIKLPGGSRTRASRVRGLSDVLATAATLPEAILPTETPGLYCLPCGTMPDELRLLLMSENCGSLFKELRAEYAYVVIHAPPLNDHPECVRLAMRTDGVGLVINEGRHRESELRQVKQSLEGFGLPILGVILSARRSWWSR